MAASQLSSLYLSTCQQESRAPRFSLVVYPSCMLVSSRFRVHCPSSRPQTTTIRSQSCTVHLGQHTHIASHRRKHTMSIRRTTDVESIVREIQRVHDLPVTHRHNQPTTRLELLEPQTHPYFIRAAEVHREIRRERITVAAVGRAGVCAAGPRVRPHVGVGAVLLSVYKRGGRVAGLVAGWEAEIPHSASGLVTGCVRGAMARTDGWPRPVPGRGWKGRRSERRSHSEGCWRKWEAGG